jgi:hypothetical protein
LGTIKSISGYLVSWPLQETSGSVAVADNVAVDLGRQLLTEDFTAGLWETSSATIDDLDSFSTVGGGGVRANDAAIANNKTYTMRIKGTTTTTTLRVRNFTGANNYGPVLSGTFDETFTFTANGDGIYLIHITAGTTDIDWANTYIKQTDILASSAYPGPEKVTNGGFDTDTDWIKSVGITISGGEVHFNDAVGGAGLQQDIGAETGKRYRIYYEVTAKTSGNLFLSGSGFTESTLLDTSVGEHWVELPAEDDQNLYFITQGGVGFIGSLDNVSTREANPLNGDHTGVAVGQTGQYRVPILVTDDGVTSNTDFLSAEYNSAYDASIDFTKMSLLRKTTWDTTERYLFYDYVDANNYVTIYTSTTQDQVVWEIMAGGTLEQITWDSGGSTSMMLLDIGRWRKQPQPNRRKLGAT